MTAAHQIRAYGEQDGSEAGQPGYGGAHRHRAGRSAHRRDEQYGCDPNTGQALQPHQHARNEYRPRSGGMGSHCSRLAAGSVDGSVCRQVGTI